MIKIENTLNISAVMSGCIALGFWFSMIFFMPAQGLDHMSEYLVSLCGCIISTLVFALSVAALFSIEKKAMEDLMRRDMGDEA